MVKMLKEQLNHKTLFYHLLVRVIPNPFFLLWNINFDARLDDCLSHHLLSLYGIKTQLKWMGTESITSFFHKRKSYKFQHCKLWQNFQFLFSLFFILFIKVMFLWNIITWPLWQLSLELHYYTLLTPVGLDESFTCQKERGTRLSGGKS